MGRGVVYCDVCGERLLEKVFDDGKTLESAGRIICDTCAKKSGVKVDQNPSSRSMRSPVIRGAKKKSRSSSRRVSQSKTPSERLFAVTPLLPILERIQHKSSVSIRRENADISPPETLYVRATRTCRDFACSTAAIIVECNDHVTV